MSRGYFGIGIENTKNKLNLGTLWRSAFLYGASFVFTIGRKYKLQSSDTVKAWRHIPLHNFRDTNDLKQFIPYDCQLVGVEMGERVKSITEFKHPKRAIYLLGAEDNGLSRQAQKACHHLVKIDTPIDWQSLNVAVAGTIVMHERIR